MRLGKVQVVFEYVVDLNNQEMVDNAKISIAEDIESAVKHDGLLLGGKTIHVIDETMEECKFLDQSDIPDFLREE